MAEFSRNVGFRLAESVVTLTPVDTGYAKNSWTVSLGNLPTSYRQAPTNPGGSPASSVSLEEAQSALLDMKADDIVFISSNTEYMTYLEHGTAHSPPVGMVAITVASARQIVAEVAAAMRA